MEQYYSIIFYFVVNLIIAFFIVRNAKVREMNVWLWGICSLWFSIFIIPVYFLFRKSKKKDNLEDNSNNNLDKRKGSTALLFRKLAILGGLIMLFIYLKYGTFIDPAEIIIGLFINVGIGAVVGGLLGELIHRLNIFFYTNQKGEKYRVSPEFIHYYRAGVEMFKNYDYVGAIREFEKAILIKPTNSATHFNLASLYSLIENKEKVFYHLSYAAEYKLENLKDKIETNPNLEFIRNQSEFNEFVANGYKL